MVSQKQVKGKEEKSVVYAPTSISSILSQILMSCNLYLSMIDSEMSMWSNDTTQTEVG